MQKTKDRGALCLGIAASLVALLLCAEFGITSLFRNHPSPFLRYFSVAVIVGIAFIFWSTRDTSLNGGKFSWLCLFLGFLLPPHLLFLLASLAYPIQTGNLGFDKWPVPLVFSSYAGILLAAPFFETAFIRRGRPLRKLRLPVIVLLVLLSALAFYGVFLGYEGLALLESFTRKLEPISPLAGFDVQMPPTGMLCLWRTLLGEYLCYFSFVAMPLLGVTCIISGKLRYSGILLFLTWLFLSGYVGYWTHDLAEVGFTPKGLSPLTLAVAECDGTTLRKLLDEGAKPNSKNRRGYTPLWGACVDSNADFVELLLKHGADPNLCSKRDLYPLIQTIGRNSDREIVDLLLNANADVNVKGWNNETALMRASRLCRPEIVKILLAHGADVNAKSKDSETALDYALKWQKVLKQENASSVKKLDDFEKVIEMLRAAGATE